MGQCCAESRKTTEIPTKGIKKFNFLSELDKHLPKYQEKILIYKASVNDFDGQPFRDWASQALD